MNKFRIALAAITLALAAVSTVDTASAFYSGYNPFWWAAVAGYYIPL